MLSFFEGGDAAGRRRYQAAVDAGFSAAKGRCASVFAQGQPMTTLIDVLAQDSLYQHPENLVAFAGNHDQPRLLTVAGGNSRSSDGDRRLC